MLGFHPLQNILLRIFVCAKICLILIGGTDRVLTNVTRNG
jgi:hypothetical protein